MERIFYFSGYRMTVFDWDGKLLFGTRDFQPDEQGFAEFEKLLKSSASFPSRLLVDMIEEDFRRESIPHVNRFERGSLIKRQLDRHYREEDYVYARLIGRSSVGRRDDQLLLSALTNTGLLTPWLDRLEQHDVQLAGIWSLPLLAEKLIRPLHVPATDEHVLIVSRQVRSALRNSYLHKGRLMISRQAKFDKEMWDKEDFEGVMKNLERSTLEIYTFLVNQRLIGAGEQLRVYCVVQDHQMEAAQALCHNDERVHYNFVSLESVFGHFKLQGCDSAGADALFSYLCSRKNPLYDHYAKEEQKSTYFRHLVDRVVRNVAEIGSLALITAAVLLALKGMELDLQQENVSLDLLQIEMESQARFGDIRNELDSATYVYESVKLLNTMKAEARQAPQEYFGVLSRVLSQPAYRPIQLLELDWQKHSALTVRQIVSEHRSRLVVPDPNQFYDPYTNAVVDDDPDAMRRAVLILKGKIDTSGLSYRETIATMNQFVEELQMQAEIDEVILVRTAADVREASRFSDQIRGDQVAVVDTDAFEVLVVLESPSNV